MVITDKLCHTLEFSSQPEMWISSLLSSPSRILHKLLVYIKPKNPKEASSNKYLSLNNIAQISSHQKEHI